MIAIPGLMNLSLTNTRLFICRGIPTSISSQTLAKSPEKADNFWKSLIQILLLK